MATKWTIGDCITIAECANEQLCKELIDTYGIAKGAQYAEDKKISVAMVRAVLAAADVVAQGAG